MNTLAKNWAGPAGEHAAMTAMTRRGWIVGALPAGNPHADLLAFDPQSGRTVSVQIKSTSCAHTGVMHKGADRPACLADFYIRVRFDRGAENLIADFWIMTRDEYAAGLKQTATGWRMPPKAWQAPAHREAWAKIGA